VRCSARSSADSATLSLLMTLHSVRCTAVSAPLTPLTILGSTSHSAEDMPLGSLLMFHVAVHMLLMTHYLTRCRYSARLSAQLVDDARLGSIHCDDAALASLSGSHMMFHSADWQQLVVMADSCP
jgi:hypothetical protein